MPMTPHDVEQLKGFLKAVKEVLDDIVKNPRPAIPGRHHKTLTAAWGEVSGVFETVEAQIASGNNWPKLDEHGLSGHQLTFKLGVFSQAYDELLDHGTAEQGATKPLSWWKKWFPRCKKVLTAADVLLGSLGAVITPVGAIKEFKKGVEACVHRTEEEHRDLPDSMTV